MSPCLVVGFNPYVFWSVVRNGVFPDSRHFLHFSVSLVLSHYETVQFVPQAPDVGKSHSSVLLFHEAIYQGLIVRFTPLEEVFPSLVCCHEKSELSTHSVSLCTPPTCELWYPPFTRVVFLGYVAIWCSTSRQYDSTRAPPRFTLLGILQSLSFRPLLLLLSAPCALSSGP